MALFSITNCVTVPMERRFLAMGSAVMTPVLPIVIAMYRRTIRNETGILRVCGRSAFAFFKAWGLGMYK